tara:strand:- start:12591 stop:12818 length:228 start_codon:yes stop_codon:yes gene_type:complete
MDIITLNDIDAIEEYQRDWQYDEMKEDVFNYLDDLKESGETNMFGATPYIMETFEINKSMSKQFLTDWMESYKDA